jgi:hypothetical protein
LQTIGDFGRLGAFGGAFFNDYKDLRKVAERTGVLLSDASTEHIEAVGKYLPVDLMRVRARSRPG